MRIEVLDPSHESDVREFKAAPRLASLNGTTVAIMSNGKKGTQPFFDAFERELLEGHGVAKVVRLTKAARRAVCTTPSSVSGWGCPRSAS
jgi:hypothetical protein